MRAAHTDLLSSLSRLLAQALLLLAACSSTAWAHAASKSQLALRVDGNVLHGELVASLVDVALALRVPPEQAPEQLRQQIGAREAQWRAYAGRGLVAFLNGQPAMPELERLAYTERDGEAALVFSFRAAAQVRIDAVDVLYTLFFEDDVLHECLVRVEWAEGRASNGVVKLSEPLMHAERSTDRGLEFWQFLKSGAWHVWTGYDHVLFLIALLLPSVLIGAPGAWAPAPALPNALLRAAAIVTAFTLAHTLTLALTALWRVDVPPRIVEPAIAASVFIAAACNLVPGTAVLAGPWMAFGFGLVHGTAFAHILGELITDRSDVWRPLLGFNVGVEVGQLAVVALFFPIAWTLRSTRFYRRTFVGGGSVALCACATVWFVARVL